ncbi:restriction endonuclease subunit S [Lactococcus lactis]|uniref:Restriction endonuclease subunit S n=2 Tax=Lactococcus lactis TaxID=1358 RepID=A0AAE9IHL3_LACLL|nr:restriction endonuclease subunit S [Lactococcus lactis]URL12689.2 restriction endonuclease subunit S [Lactococcus lactis subsp. lactis]
MAKIDDSVKKKVPELRFKGFTDEWEERKLKDVVEKQIKGKAQFEKLAQGDVEYLDTSRLNGGQALLTNGLKDVSLDDILILWDGSKAGTVYHGFEGALGSTLKAYRTSANSKFVYQYLKRHQDNIYNNYRTPNIPHVQKDFLNVFTISIPGSDEQAKIGSFFKKLDDTIALHQRKLDLLKEQKKGYLQKMFPKNGAKVPELRFAGFADDWEERKLSSMTNYKNGKSHEDKQSTSGKLELINLNSISISGGLKHSGKFIDEADDTLQKDDLVMILSDVGHGDLLGRVALIPEDDRFVLNQRVALLRPNTTADPQFLFSYINAHQYYFKAQGAGMSQLNISKGSVENFISFVPIIEEQKKIGSFFKQLDETIALHQRKLDLLKEQKKGFLQKMFV